MSEEKKGERWYTKLFGGRKSMHGFWASLLGVLGFLWIPNGDKLDALPYVLAYWLLCFGFQVTSNVVQKIKLNGGNIVGNEEELDK